MHRPRRCFCARRERGEADGLSWQPSSKTSKMLQRRADPGALPRPRAKPSPAVASPGWPRWRKITRNGCRLWGLPGLGAGRGNLGTGGDGDRVQRSSSPFPLPRRCAVRPLAMSSSSRRRFLPPLGAPERMGFAQEVAAAALFIEELFVWTRITLAFAGSESEISFPVCGAAAPSLPGETLLDPGVFSRAGSLPPRIPGHPGAPLHPPGHHPGASLMITDGVAFAGAQLRNPR